MQVQRVTAGQGEDDRRAFLKFLQYLGDRSRAGVVKLPPLTAVPVGGQGGPRTMYLIPPSSTICETLQVAWEPRECMLALVVPASLK